MKTKTTAPASAALVRVGSTATPVITAGRASSGRASRVAKTTSADAVMPDAAAPEGTPARTSIEYCTAPTVAAPPGTTLPNELAASCERITGRHCWVRTASRRIPHAQAKLPTWSTTIATNQSGLISSSSSNAPKTPIRAGASR